MNKFVIYSAIIGNYDELLQPLVVDPDFDFVLFSNDIHEKQIGVWQIRPIKYQNEIQTKIARWVKTHPEVLLPDYESCLWIDARELIKSDLIYRVIKFYTKSKVLIATHDNPELSCIYQEMLSMMLQNKETEQTTIKWGSYLRSEDYPRWIGTNETGLLFRKHSEPLVQDFDRLWWWCIDKYSRRDQFSFHYVLWKLNIECYNILPPDIDVRHSEHIEVKDHLSTVTLTNDCSNSGQLIKYYRKHVNERQEIENVLYWIYGRSSPFFWYTFIGLFYRIKHLILFYLGRPNDSNYANEVSKIKKHK